MILLWNHPKVATRDCGHCIAVVYDETKGTPRTLAGKEIPRPPGSALPCRGCAKGPIPFAKGLTEANVRALVHYRICKATGRFPEDATVARTALIVSELEAQLERARLIETLESMRGA